MNWEKRRWLCLFPPAEDIQTGGTLTLHSPSPARTDGVHNLAADTPVTLSHAVTDPGHSHAFTSGYGGNVPAYRYLRFIERIDNSG